MQFLTLCYEKYKTYLGRKRDRCYIVAKPITKTQLSCLLYENNSIFRLIYCSLVEKISNILYFYRVVLAKCLTPSIGCSTKTFFFRKDFEELYLAICVAGKMLTRVTDIGLQCQVHRFTGISLLEHSKQTYTCTMSPSLSDGQSSNFISVG